MDGRKTMPNGLYAGPARARRHHQVSRPRQSYSCHTCRARRVKCDKVQPSCGRCLEGQDICTYDHPPSSRTSPATEDGFLPSLRKKRKLSHDTAEDASCIQEVHSDPSVKNVVLETDSDALPGLGYLSLQKGGRSRYVGRTFWAYVEVGDHELENLLQDQDRYSRTEHEMGPRQGTYDSYYSVPTQNDASSLRSAQPMPHQTQLQSLWQEGSSKNSMKSRAVKPAGQYATYLPKLLEDLPARKACDLLYQSFVASIHAIIPLIHLPSFNEEYERFWRWIEIRERKTQPMGILAENPSFLTLLFAILFSGSISCPTTELQAQFPHTPRSDITSRLCEAAKRTQSLVLFPRNPTIYSLMSYLIVQNLLVREEEPLASCSYISVALRVAQAMGLHRDGSNFGLPPIEAEIRRRIWWHIIHTDVMTSIPSALPPSCLSDTIYDTKMICEFKDDQIDSCRTQDSDPPETNPPLGLQPIYSISMEKSVLDVRLMVAVDRYCITSTLRHILRRQFDTTPLTKNDFMLLKDEADGLNSRISARIDQLRRIRDQQNDSHLPSTADRQGNRVNDYENGFDECAFITWAQLLLKLMVHKTYSVLYQPLVRDPSHLFWAQVRTDCLNHCQQFMQIFLEMCTSDSFRPYHWLYPGLYQPLHAAVVLLSDLLRTPQSPEAERSMILIDKLFSLISPHDGVVSEENGVFTERYLSEGGREAWSLLRRLRRRAWQKIGRDPDILWTEEDSWDIRSAAVPPSTPALHETSSAEPSSTSEMLDTPLFESNENPFDPVTGCSEGPFASSEYAEYFLDPALSSFRWLEWDAAILGNSDMQGV